MQEASKKHYINKLGGSSFADSIFTIYHFKNLKKAKQKIIRKSENVSLFIRVVRGYSFCNLCNCRPPQTISAVLPSRNIQTRVQEDIPRSLCF